MSRCSTHVAATSASLAPGTGAKAKLAPADRILITVLRLRKLATMDLLGRLFGVTAMTISHAKQLVRPLRPTKKQDQESTLVTCTP